MNKDQTLPQPSEIIKLSLTSSQLRVLMLQAGDLLFHLSSNLLLTRPYRFTDRFYRIHAKVAARHQRRVRLFSRSLDQIDTANTAYWANEHNNKLAKTSTVSLPLPEQDGQGDKPHKPDTCPNCKGWGNTDSEECPLCCGSGEYIQDYEAYYQFIRPIPYYIPVFQTQGVIFSAFRPFNSRV